MNGDYPAGAWVQTDDQAAAGTYIWKDYAHGDNAHYGTYSLYTEMNVENGVLTGINLTSAVDTFFGKWGTYSPHEKGWTIYGYLPDGVDFAYDKDIQTDVATVTPHLKGADELGYSISGVYFYSCAEDGTTVGQEVKQKGGTMHVDYDASVTAGRGATSPSDTDTDTYAFESSTGKITVKNSSYNIVKVVYKIGEYAPFDCYMMIDETAGKYGDVYLDSLSWTDYSDDVAVAGMGLTNRDRWGKTLLTETVQRWLIPWINGETEELDAISGATKTATPFDEALNQAAIAGYFTSVAEDVAISIDAGAADEQTFTRDDYTDQTTVVKNDAGQYALTADFFRSESGDSHGVSPNKIELYTIDKSGAAVTQDLQRATPSYEAVASTTSVSAAYEDDNMAWDPDTFTLTVKNADVNYARIVYTLGHADSRHAYNLADMVQVADVEAQIDAMDTQDPASIAAARAAYEALSSDVLGFVNNFSKIVDAEKAFQIASVKVVKSSVTYTGKALKPAVTVTAVDGSTIDAANYTVSYSNNTNVGTAAVTVAGTGNYTGTADASFKITKAANTLKLKAASKTFKVKKVKSKKQTVTIKVKTNKSKGKVTYSVTKKVKKAGVSVNAKGKVTVKKGTKKGTYKITVKTAATKNYKAATKTFTVKVK